MNHGDADGDEDGSIIPLGGRSTTSHVLPQVRLISPSE